MHAYWTLTRRELAAYFVSLTGYLIIAAAALLLGLSLVVLVIKLQAQPTPMPVTELFFSTPFFWLVVLLASPVITMRLFAQEKFSGTFETLMTAPVTDAQVVLAKFTAALVFYLVMWLPLPACLAILHQVSGGQPLLDVRALGCAFLGITLLGGVFMALGCLASALTHNQFIAAMLSFAGGIGLFLLSFLADQVTWSGRWQQPFFAYISLIEHVRDFARGVVDSRPVVFHLTLTAFLLFLTLRVVESRRWR